MECIDRVDALIKCSNTVTALQNKLAGSIMLIEPKRSGGKSYRRQIRLRRDINLLQKSISTVSGGKD